jgi:aspartate aminotransferase
MNISDRIIGLNEPQTIAMAQKSRDLQAQGFDVINLSIGEPDFTTPQHIQDAAIEAIQSQKYFAYPPVAGYPDLKEAVCKKMLMDNGLEYTPNQVVIATGAKQAVINTILCTVNPGDEVILPAPFWVSYELMVQIAEGVPVRIHTTIEQNYKMSPAQLEAAITPKTKAFLFSSPCNPTGTVYSQDELEEFAKIFRKNPQIVVISDEIYEFINFRGKHASIALCDGMKDRTVIINGMSKGFAMTGWRLGYSISSPELAKAIEKMQSQYTSGANTIAQRAALAALIGSREPSMAMKEAFLRRRNLVVAGLKQIPGIKMNNPEGAFYAFPEISSYFGKSYSGRVIHHATDLAMYLLEEGHVATVTGEAFGDPKAIRLSFAASDEQLSEAINRIQAALAKLQ